MNKYYVDNDVYDDFGNDDKCEDYDEYDDYKYSNWRLWRLWRLSVINNANEKYNKSTALRVQTAHLFSF